MLIQEASVHRASITQRWHDRQQVKRDKGDIFSSANAIFPPPLFTYYRVWGASSPRSVATTGRRWRNFAVDRRLDPSPRSNTTNSCWPWFFFFYSPSANVPPSRATHPRAIYAMLRPLELVRLPQLLERDARQGQLIAAVRVENLQPGTSPHNLSGHENSGQSLIGRDSGSSRKLCGNAPKYRSADSVLHKIFKGRRRCGWNREKPDRKGKWKKYRTEQNMGRRRSSAMHSLTLTAVINPGTLFQFTQLKNDCTNTAETTRN